MPIIRRHHKRRKKASLFGEAFSLTGNLVRYLSMRALGLLLAAISLYTFASLFYYSPWDASWNVVTDQAHETILGSASFVIADLLLQTLGYVGWFAPPLLMIWGIRLTFDRPFSYPKTHVLASVTSLVFLCFSLYALNVQGSTLGHVVFNFYALFSKHYFPLIFQSPTLYYTLAGFFLLMGSGSYIYALGIPKKWWSILGSSSIQILYTLFFTLRKTVSFMLNSLFSSHKNPVADRPRRTLFHDKEPLDKQNASPDFCEEDFSTKATKPSHNRSSKPTPKAQKNISFTSSFHLPDVNLIALPSKVKSKELTDTELQERAAALEKTLSDFGVRGVITDVNPGPVVTLYEFKPAPGIKTSRIVALADDIARSMSARSARVAVIPGKNALGIELPNEVRETVFFRSLLSAPSYKNTQDYLPLILGKDISGTPSIADLSKMPHLLIAGTTGSGKSVAINTMILSLLYHLPPDLCKFIMIDPKMLELSVYEGIPHLLTPVVTSPKKAIVALKWAVREMEERYARMSKFGVRNIMGYNQKIEQAREKGETLTRRVQTGYDPETGNPLFEEQPLNMETIPYIVVIVDEMADLMLVAGKEIEATIQRLAQMARAAGIHLIMATQRPSVDVITGTIKANFPTRISFQVSSKIDSRTILGEPGAEQLLGQGDMLYMAGGGRTQRIHGPFVSDDDIEKVVTYLKGTGSPAYIEDVIRDEDGDNDTLSQGNNQDKDPLFDQVVSLIVAEKKASTSFIQRHFQIGYNRAARIMDQLEAENIVSAPNHVGRREILAR